MQIRRAALVLAALSTVALSQDIPRPRIMVIATAASNMDEQRDDEAMRTIEQVFQDRGFETIDAMQLESIKDIDDALNAGDKEKILFLRTRFGCEVVVAVKYDKQMVTGGAPNSMWWYLFNGKAVRTDTASQIASKSHKSANPRKSFNHFAPTAEEFALDMAQKIEKAWQNQQTQGLKIQFFVSRGDAATFRMLEDSMRGMPRVSACSQRRFQRDTAEYEVTYGGNVSDFVADLSNLRSPALLVTGMEGNRVDAEITSAPPPPPADTTPPQVRITSPANGSLLNQSGVTVFGTVDDRTVSQVQVNGVYASVNGGNFQANLRLNEGQNSIEASATDAAGNRGSDRVSVTVDTVGPQVSIVAPTNGKNLTETQCNVGVRVTHNGDLDYVEVNGVRAELFREPDTFKATITLAEGQNLEIRAVAYDRARNSGTDRILVNVDTTPPQVDGKVTVIVSGKVDDPSHKVTVNGTPVTVRPDGSWELTVDISQSKIVKIATEDEFGNQTVNITARMARRTGAWLRVLAVSIV